MDRFVSFKLFTGIFCSFLLLMSFVLATAQAHPRSAMSSSPGTNQTHTSSAKSVSRAAAPQSIPLDDVTCIPYLTGTAFPYSAPLSAQEVSETECPGATIAWGWTTAGSATGNAYWNADTTLGPITIYAFIPSSHAGAQDAQYFIHSGSKYVANIIVNQNNVSGWVKLGKWNFSDIASVTLRDLSPSGSTGWQIAASAMDFHHG